MLLLPFGGSIWGSFGVRDGGPSRPKFVFFHARQRPSVFLPSGALWGCFWEVFGTTSGYLEIFFVNDFEKILVFVHPRLLAPLLPIWMHICHLSCAASMSCQYVCLIH